MKKNEQPKDKFDTLKKQAEDILAEQPASMTHRVPEKIHEILHELHTHKIELELQNAELCKTQEELNQSRQKFSDLYDFAPVGYLTVSSTGLILEANLTSASMLGIERGRLIKQPISVFIMEEDQDIYYHYRKTLLKTQETQLCELRIKKRGGNPFYAQLRSTFRSDLDGVLGQFRITITDINEQKESEIALKKKEFEQREILNFMSEAVIAIDQSGLILKFNTAAEQLFGYTTKEIIGQPVNRLLPESASQQNGYLHRFMETGELHISIDRDVEGLHKNNSLFPMHLSLDELPEDTDGRRRFIASCHDLTQRKRQEEQIRRNQKMDALGKLTGGVAHDYNNMLGIIIGYAKLLKDGLSEQPELAKYAHQIYHAGERGAKLTTKLLAFSGKTAFEETLCNMNALLLNEKNVLEKLLTPLFKLIFKLSDEPCFVLIDEGDLEDALLNLSINAMHAMESGGQLTFQTSHETINELDARTLQIDEGNYVVLSITDTGRGMTEETIAMLFEPFFSTKGEKGTGLGLSQVYGFVERSRGAIKVTSRLREGSQFTLYFPQRDPHDFNSEEEDILLAVDQGNETILIVEDEPALLELTREILNFKGYITLGAKNASQALNILEHETIDLLLSDVIMPDMDGYTLAAIVKGKYPEVKIQLISGFQGNCSLEKIDAHLQQNLLKKPCDAKVLLQRIRELLDQ